MRRTAAAALIAVTAMALPTAVASAGPGTSVTVVSRSGLPSPLIELSEGSSCGTPTSLATLAHVSGPVGAPLGHGSLAVTVPAHGYAGLTESLPSGTLVSALTALSFSTYQPPAPTIPNNYLGLGLLMATAPDSNDLYYIVQLGLPASGTAAWQATDIFSSGTEVTWTKYKLVPGSTTEISHDTQPWTTFAANNPSAVLSALTIAALPDCGRQVTTFDLDDLVLGLGNTTTTDDFEPLITTTLNATLSTLASGRVGRSTVTLHAPGGTAARATLQLWVKTPTFGKYIKMGTFTSNAKGSFTTRPLRLRVNTTVQWRYVGSPDNAAAASAPVSVKVPSSVTLRAKSTTVGAHHVLRATGDVYYPRKGEKVTLWRLKGGHRTALGHTPVRASGGYTITKRLAAGRYKVIATVPASRFNARGSSVPRTVTLD